MSDSEMEWTPLIFELPNAPDYGTLDSDSYHWSYRKIGLHLDDNIGNDIPIIDQLTVIFVSFQMMTWEMTFLSLINRL